jgi:EpsI family protein
VSRAGVIPQMLGFLMLISGIEAYFLTPRAEATSTQPPLAQVIPERFGDWHAIVTPEQVVDPATERDARDPFFTLYDDVLMRAYQNTSGRVVLLALAYGKHQRQEFKIHRPELCYVAQGFRLLNRNRVVFPLVDRRNQPVIGSRMLVQSPARVEIVSYWIRIGSLFTESGWSTRYYLLKQGIGGHVLDGILVRVSQIVPSVDDGTAGKYALQEEFLSELVRASPAAAEALLIG